jgi:hypothetical protein
VLRRTIETTALDMASSIELTQDLAFTEDRRIDIARNSRIVVKALTRPSPQVHKPYRVVAASPGRPI